MTISPGYTNDEIRELVYTYDLQPWSTREAWLAEQGVTRDRFRRRRTMVYDGDLARGLIPREGSNMTSSPVRRHVARIDNESAREKEQLRARIRELEATNGALGKAIGLLHQLNEHEPDIPETPEQPSS